MLRHHVSRRAIRTSFGVACTLSSDLGDNREESKLDPSSRPACLVLEPCGTERCGEWVSRISRYPRYGRSLWMVVTRSSPHLRGFFRTWQLQAHARWRMSCAWKQSREEGQRLLERGSADCGGLFPGEGTFTIALISAGTTCITLCRQKQLCSPTTMEHRASRYLMISD
jgi:hypothetical protein